MNVCYKVARNLAELYSSALWTAEFVSNEFGYLARRFLSKVLKVQTGYSLLLYSKM